MSGNAANIILGPSKGFLAPYVTAVPTLTGAESDFSAFIEFGFSQDGFEWDYSSQWKDIVVDERMGIVKKKLISHKLMAGSKLSEATLQNLYFAMAGSTLVSPTELSIGTVTDAPEFRLGWIGTAPNGGTRMAIVYRCVSIAAVKAHVQRKAETIYQVQFEGLSDTAITPITADLCTYKDFATPYVYA